MTQPPAVSHPAQPAIRAHERPVFVSDDARRARRLRYLGRFAFCTMASWLAAMIVGTAGFATMPALSAASLASRAAHSSPPHAVVVVDDDRPPQSSQEARAARRE